MIYTNKAIIRKKVLNKMLEDALGDLSHLTKY